MTHIEERHMIDKTEILRIQIKVGMFCEILNHSSPPARVLRRERERKHDISIQCEAHHIKEVTKSTYSISP